MASSLGPITEMLTCPICLETYKSPMYLPCLHSFCDACIKTFIISRTESDSKDADTKMGFPCPVCRTFTPMHSASVARETWSDHLPANHFIESLLDMQLIEKKEKLCDACSSRNETKPAVSWCLMCSEALCKECDICHRSFKISRDHKLISLIDLAEEKSMFKSSNVVYCTEHKSEPVNIYCKDHETPCCNTCATIKHRKCDVVVSIEEASSGYRTSPEIQKVLNNLEKKNDEITVTLGNISKNIEEFNAQKKDIEKQILTFRSNLNAHMDKLEANVRSSLEVTEKNYSLKMEENVAELTRLKSAIDNCRSVLKACVDHGSDVQCLVEFNKVKVEDDKYDQSLKKKGKDIKLSGLQFQVDRSAEEIVEKVKSLGDISVLEIKSLIDDDLREGVVIAKHNATFSKCSSGIYVSDKIVVADYEQKKIVILNADLSQRTHMQLPGKPRNLSVIDEDEQSVVISLPESNEVVVVSVKLLSIIRKIKTAETCWGIDYKCGLLAIANNTTISIVEFENEKEIDKFTTADTWFVKLTENGDCIYSTKSGQIMKYEKQKGPVVFLASNELQGGRGVDTDWCGNIYIIGLNSYNILQISTQGKISRAIPTKSLGLTGYPWSISFRPKSGEFLVTSVTGEVVVCEIVSLP